MVRSVRILFSRDYGDVNQREGAGGAAATVADRNKLDDGKDDFTLFLDNWSPCFKLLCNLEDVHVWKGYFPLSQHLSITPVSPVGLAAFSAVEYLTLKNGHIL